MKNALITLKLIFLFYAYLVGQPVNEQVYLDLGGESQYVEILGKSAKNPVLLFVHGGPAWPQTPQFRYYNSDISNFYTVVLWEQRGAGNSAKNNPRPSNLNLKQIVHDGHELTNWLKNRFNTEKIFLAGYSWGSLVGVHMVKEQPENYEAYIGIAQVVSMEKAIEISQNWIREQAENEGDTRTLQSLDSLSNLSYYTDHLDRFFNQWLLLKTYNGATFNTASELETEKAMALYDDYKDYDWFSVWEHSARKMQKDMFETDILGIDTLETPVFLLQGRHDWNIPSVLAEEWLEKLTAPEKKLFWFENSGHGPLEEEPEKFNLVMGQLIMN